MKKILIVVAASLLAIIIIPASYILFIQTIIFSPLGLSLPTVTQTRLGAHADPINVVMIGDKDKISTAFKKAGWLVPDKIDKRSTAKIILASIRNTSYPSAPISSLYLFKRTEDLAFEFPTETVRKRHHIRLWRTTESVAHQEVWVGADTYDSHLELSHKDLLPTHHVDANIDQEKDFLLISLTKTNTIKNEATQRLTYPFILGFNGNGDWYHDDGNVIVLTLR